MIRRQILVIMTALVIAFTGQAMAQKPTDAQLEDALWNCLSKRVPGTDRDAGDHTRAFNPNTGQNFVYDKDKNAWIDAKTGEAICPKSTTSAGLEDAFWSCLSERIPGTDRDAGDHTRAFDPNTGRNFVYDKDKGAWIDAKTGECLCPKCPPPTATTTPPPGGPSAEDLRRMRQSLERESGSGGIYVPLPPPEQQTPAMPMPLPQPRRMPTTPGDMTPTPNWPTSPVPKGPATVTPAPGPAPGSTTSVTPAPTGFPGRWRGDNGCGIGSLTIVSDGGKLVAQGMPGNGSVPLAADGPTATAQGVVLFGQPNHQLLLSLSGSQMQIQGRNPKGGSCNENFVRQ